MALIRAGPQEDRPGEGLRGMSDDIGVALEVEAEPGEADPAGGGAEADLAAARGKGQSSEPGFAAKTSRTMSAGYSCRSGRKGCGQVGARRP
jgi:hypothetical protein